MVMTWQIREYTIKPGAMAEWVDEFRTRIVPLRVQHGFQVLGAWTVNDSDHFVWIVGYDGPKSWDQANDDYVKSPERRALDPDPARHITHMETRLMRGAYADSVRFS